MKVLETFFCPEWVAYNDPGPNAIPIHVWKQDRWQVGNTTESGGWKASTAVPRTCSWCGSIHPVDAFTLLANNWEVELTDDSTKFYLRPPGFRGMTHVLLERIRARALDKAIPSVWLPAPPVYGRTGHFTDDQIADLNTRATG